MQIIVTGNGIEKVVANLGGTQCRVLWRNEERSKTNSVRLLLMSLPL